MPGDEAAQFAKRARLPGLHVGPPRQEAALHGTGNRPARRVELRHRLALGTAGIRLSPQATDPGARGSTASTASQPHALYQVDFNYTGFEWIDFHDWEASIIAFLRRAEDPPTSSSSAATSLPSPRQGYEFGVPEEGFYEEILNTDSELFGGSRHGQRRLRFFRGRCPSTTAPYSIAVTLPPLRCVVAFRKR